MTATERFAEWALGLTFDDVPTPAQHAAKRHLLDGYGCALAASPDYADAVDDPAFSLGVRIHALDFDDTHADALVHATAVVLPAVAVAGSNADGAEALTAAIAGYEVVCRLGAAVRHGFHARGLHATSVCGVFSSALIASRLSGFDVATTVSALGIAGSFASGSLEFLATGAATKQIHPGWASHAGLAAARLAAAGAEGPSSILEGERGIFRALADATVTPEALTDGLGARWEVERITIKPYPACQLSHASLDALRAAGVLDPSAIDSITFEVPADAVPIVCEPRATKLAPRTPYDAKFSLPYCAAALLIDGTLGLDVFTPEAIARPDVLALAERVRVEVTDPGVAAADAPGRVVVAMSDGRGLVGEVKASRGGPADPLSDDELVAKFIANGGDRAQADRFMTLERARSIAEVLA